MRDDVETEMESKWVNIVGPLIEFLVEHEETHAFISNHLATSAAALLRWHKLVNSEAAENKGIKIIESILANQSDEGWFLEYQGADPGYQTLCLNYLADIHSFRPDLKLQKPLRNSIRYLLYFLHPDGSFGGIYGSRNTRFYYPSGILCLSEEIPEARYNENDGSVRFKKTVVTIFYG